jgi:signal transduction histidine kinase
MSKDLKPVVSADVRYLDGWIWVPGAEHVRSFMGIPLVVRGHMIGVLMVDHSQPGFFGEVEMQLAQGLAQHAAQTIENARLYQELRRYTEQLEEIVDQRTAELQNALQRAQEADRAKSVFVSNVSHELRTPLTNLRLFLDLLDRARPEKRESYLVTLRREAVRLQELIESLLQLSRLDLAKTEANLQPVELNALIDILSNDRKMLISNRGLNLEVELDEKIPLVMADPKLIEQVFANLLTNAINYTQPGGSILLRTGKTESEGQTWVTASVIDTGLCISEEDQAHLFERFYRGQAARDSGTPGTGLGLAISKEITNLHNGWIKVESQPGRGSTFTVFLPIL